MTVSIFVFVVSTLACSHALTNAKRDSDPFFKSSFFYFAVMFAGLAIFSMIGILS